MTGEIGRVEMGIREQVLAVPGEWMKDAMEDIEVAVCACGACEQGGGCACCCYFEVLQRAVVVVDTFIKAEKARTK